MPWLSWNAWKPWQSTEYEFHGWALLLDLAVLITFVCMVTAAWEWRRRRRKRTFQFRISELLLLITVIAAMLGWFRYQENESVRELALVKALRDNVKLDIDFGFHNVAPDWLQRFVGEALLPDYLWRDTVVELNSNSFYGESAASVEWTVSHIKQLKHCQRLEVDNVAAGWEIPFAEFATIPQLRTLDLSYSSSGPHLIIDVDGAKNLSHMQQITRLIVPERSSILPEALAVIRRKLPNCEVVYEDEQDD